MSTWLSLYPWQEDAVKRMKNGCILCGGVGAGKSRTAIAYYYKQYGGDLYSDRRKKMNSPPDLYIITTARKRDTKEWEKELDPFGINQVTIDSWNNIKKYKDVEHAFFIFDEQRVVGYGTWAKSFIKISRHNKWILLSATPGDTWSDYIPVFIANGYYKNKSEFVSKHVIWSHFAKFPKIDHYVGQGILNRYRKDILVTMDYHNEAEQHHQDIWCEFDAIGYRNLMRSRWNIYKDCPITNAGELCYCLRRFVNTDISREWKIVNIVASHPRTIIFYNFDYELELLRSLDYGPDVIIAEWNGHKHEPIPINEKWVYLVQYTAGSEGWNCTETDTIIFFSQNYSYKVMLQAAGRIDRANTPFKHLYYYHLKSHSGIDMGIMKALKEKKDFNEKSFVEKVPGIKFQELEKKPLQAL